MTGNQWLKTRNEKLDEDRESDEEVTKEDTDVNIVYIT